MTSSENASQKTQLALLGTDPAVLPVLHALAESPLFHLTHAVFAEDLLADLLPLFPGLNVHTDWEQLLIDPSLELVIVCGGDEKTLEITRQLGNAGLSLVLIPAASQGIAFCYELSLIRDSLGTQLLPVLPRLSSQALRELRREIAGREWGDLRLLQFRRTLTDTNFTRARLQAEFLRDVILLRHLGGPFGQVTAILIGEQETGISQATISLGGSVTEATWTLESGTSDSWSLTVRGTEGERTIDSQEIETVEATELLAQLDADSPSERLLDWKELIRCWETVDAVPRSVRKRRTIDLHFETVSERSQFKTQMTALGCGLLCFTLFGLIVTLLVGAVFPVPKGVMVVLWVLVFLPLFLFLGMQPLFVLTRPATGETANSVSSSPESAP